MQHKFILSKRFFLKIPWEIKQNIENTKNLLTSKDDESSIMYNNLQLTDRNLEFKFRYGFNNKLKYHLVYLIVSNTNTQNKCFNYKLDV